MYLINIMLLDQNQCQCFQLPQKQTNKLLTLIQKNMIFHHLLKHNRILTNKQLQLHQLQIHKL